MKEKDLYLKNLSKAIKNFRLANSKTQERFSGELGYSLSHYQYIERGNRKPSLKFLYNLTKLGFSIDSALYSDISDSRSNTIIEINALLRLCSDHDLEKIKDLVSSFAKNKD